MLRATVLAHAVDLLQRGDRLLLHLLELLSLMMSSFQPVSCAARRTFCPLRPIASESFSSGTTSSMRPSASSTMTLFTSAGWIAAHDEARRIAVARDDVDLLAAQLLHDGLHARALHADARAHRIDVRVARVTAIFERAPGSRAHATIRTMPS